VKTYLVTGGAGFIGSHLVDSLLEIGARVRVLDDLSTGKRENLDPRAELVVGDAADVDVARTACSGTDGVFHLAAVASVVRSNEDWVGSHRANVTATVAVMDGARRAGCVPVVYASSAAVYGDQPPGAISEDAQARPRTAYGADKFSSELHGEVAWGVHRVPTFGFRFFNVYGPRQDPSSPYSGVMSIFVDRASKGLPIGICGDGLQTRDFVYVADVCRFLLAGMNSLRVSPAAEVVNVCTGRSTSVIDLAAEVCGALGVSHRVEFLPPRDGDIRESLGNPDFAKARLGMVAGVTLPSGVGRLVREADAVRAD
jgi:UDP-glucose 4-epimerase